MARHAFLLGGSGQIGLAAARALLERGWEVTIGSRGNKPLPAELAAALRTVRVDRDADDLTDAVGDGVDVLLDIVAYEPRHAAQLLALAGRVGSAITVSSGSVYADDEGRTLDEATGPEDFPTLPVPIPETQRTVEPGDETYSTKKAAIERALLDQDALPATVVRPCAIHGPGSELPREWFFVKRALDGRRYVLLAYRGESRFHTTSVANLAELIALAAERPATRVLNCGDPDPPNVREIARTIATILGHEWTEVLLPGPPGDDRVGATPWSTPEPFVVAMDAAERELDYRPVVTYAEAVAEVVDWLVTSTRGRDWREVFSEHGAKYLERRFDYEAEDAFVAGLRDSAP